MSKLSEIVIKIKADAIQYRETLKSAALESKLRMQQMREDALRLRTAHTDLGKSTDGLLSKFKNLGLGVIGNIARFTAYYLAVGALKNIFGGAIDEMRKFDEALRNIQSITLQSDEEISQLSQDLLALVFSGDAAGASASDLAAGMYELVSAGYNSSEALGLIQIAAVGAAAGLSTVQNSSLALLGILQSYHLPVSQAAEVMDQLFTIVDLGVIHFDDLVTGLGYLIPTAAALEIPLNEVGAAIEMLTRQGQMSSRVMTNLNDLMTRLLKPNKDLALVIADLGFSSGKAMVDALGFAGTIQALERASHDTTRAIKEQAEETEHLQLAQQSANLALADVRDREIDAAEAVKEAQEALNKPFKFQKDRDKAQRDLVKAQRDYQKALIATREAEMKVSAATAEYTDKVKTNSMTLEDSEGKLARMVGDVRAMRALLPLAAEGGALLNAQLAEHNRVVGEGERTRKALNEQLKSFNLQSKLAVSNLKAFIMAMIGPLLPFINKLLVSFNKWFHQFSDWDEKQGKWVLNLYKLKDAVRKVWMAVIAVATLLGAAFIGPFALIIGGILLLLFKTNTLDDAFRLLKKTVSTVFNVIKSVIEAVIPVLERFAHFFALGLGGGAMGGKHSFIEKMVFGIGKAIRDALPYVKTFISTIKELVRLFLLGFKGGGIGGEFSGLEKAAFKAGQVVSKILDFLKQKVVPFALTTIVDAAKSLYAWLLKMQTKLEEIWNSPVTKNAIAAFIIALNVIGQVISFVVKKVGEFFASEAGQKVLEFLGKIVPIIAAVALAMNPFVMQFSAAVLVVWSIVKAIEWLVVQFNMVKDAIGNAWNAMIAFANGIGTKFSEIKDAIGGFIEDAIATLSSFPSRIGELASRVYTEAKGIGSSFVDGIVEGLKSMAGSTMEIAGTIYAALKGAFNQALMWAHNNLKKHIGKIGVGKFAVDLGDLQFPLVQFAKGVRDWGGGLAMMGEKGPEAAILPRGTSVANAPKTSRIMDNLARTDRGGATVNANFNINGQTLDQIQSQLLQSVSELMRDLRQGSIRRGAALNSRLQIAPS